jgi:hypothetical protein
MGKWRCEVDNNIRDDINVVSGFACESLTVIKSPLTCRWGETSVQAKQVISRCCLPFASTAFSSHGGLRRTPIEVINHPKA